MIVSTVNGNLITYALAGRYSGIAHGANCQNTMKSGIAPMLCNIWPQMRKADMATVKGARTKLGSYSKSYCDKLDMHLFNLYTQFHWRGRKFGNRDLDYDAVAEVFMKLNLRYNLDQYVSKKPFGIPMIGAGLAGGDWEAIRAIINLTTPNLDIEVVFLQ